MLASKPGTYLATIIEKAVTPSGKNQLTTFIAKYRLTEEIGVGPIDDEQTVTGYHYLEKLDGSLNTFTIDALKKATGWDGRDPFWLEDSLPADTVVKLTLESDTYQGKTSIKVAFINHRDDGGSGVTKATPDQRRDIATRLGAKLRANAGGTPAPAPKPATPPPAPKKPAAPAPGCTKEDAWAAFAKDAKPENVESEWMRILAELFPTKGDDDMTASDWARMKSEGPAKYVPF